MKDNFKLPGGFTKYTETELVTGVYFGEDFYIKQVIYNNPATIVFWSDGTKTVAKCNEFEDKYDKEKGLLLCIMKKLYSKDKISDLFTYWTDENDDNITLQKVRAKQRKAYATPSDSTKVEKVTVVEVSRKSKKEIQNILQKKKQELEKKENN